MSEIFSVYYDDEAVNSAVQDGRHRELIGGMWDEIGNLQLEFLKSRGLRPENRLLDVGCGSLRLGVRAVDYLLPANYWATDISPALLDAGYDKEIIPAGLSSKLPRSHLIVDSEFQFPGIPTSFDFAIAQSLFTHLPFNHLRLCLTNLGRKLTSSCTFFFTVFIPPDGLPVTDSHRQSPGGVVTHTHRDPFHYTLADIQHAAAGSGWLIELVGEWNHPRNQMMVKAQIG